MILKEKLSKAPANDHDVEVALTTLFQNMSNDIIINIQARKINFKTLALELGMTKEELIQYLFLDDTNYGVYYEALKIIDEKQNVKVLKK